MLLQIPQGALPVQNGFYTRGFPVRLEPYATRTMEYFFYFPEPGSFAHYPVHVAQNEEVIARAEAFVFNVVETTQQDRQDVLGLRVAARQRCRGAGLPRRRTTSSGSTWR